MEIEPKGDCYEAAATYMLMGSMGAGEMEAGAKIVHGEVEGTGGAIKGLRYGHAWIEYGEACLEVANGKHIEIPKAAYYAMGKVGKTYEYEWSEARAWMVKTEIYGPWELETESGY